MLFFFVFLTQKRDDQKRHKGNNEQYCNAKHNALNNLYRGKPIVTWLFHRCKHFFIFFGEHPRATHEQAVRVNAIRRAGNKGHVVLLGVNVEQAGVGWFHHVNGVYLVIKRSAQHFNFKDIAQL